MLSTGSTCPLSSARSAGPNPRRHNMLGVWRGYVSGGSKRSATVSGPSTRDDLVRATSPKDAVVSTEVASRLTRHNRPGNCPSRAVRPRVGRHTKDGLAANVGPSVSPKVEPRDPPRASRALAADDLADRLALGLGGLVEVGAGSLVEVAPRVRRGAVRWSGCGGRSGQGKGQRGCIEQSNGTNTILSRGCEPPARGRLEGLVSWLCQPGK